MIVCKELNESFENKEDLFKALRENAKDILSIKKKTIYTGYNTLNPEESKCFVSNSQIKLKSLSNGANKDLFKDDSFFYFVINTTGVLDSHNDLHVKGIWNKSAKTRSGKNYLIDTHNLSMKTTFAFPKDVEIFTADIPFKTVGKDYKGNTEALIYKVAKDKFRDKELAKELEEGLSVQCSVKMQYIQSALAMNSEDEEDKEYLKAYKENVTKIANLHELDEKPLYFFIQSEAKNVHEGSIVPFGSNSVTGVITSNKARDSLKDTQGTEAVKSNTSSFII